MKGIETAETSATMYKRIRLIKIDASENLNSGDKNGKNSSILTLESM